MTDSIYSEYARDDAENRLDALAEQALQANRGVSEIIFGLASYVGASQSDRVRCLEAIQEAIEDLTYDARTELENLINDLTDQIERSDAPYQAQVA